MPPSCSSVVRKDTRGPPHSSALRSCLHALHFSLELYIGTEVLLSPFLCVPISGPLVLSLVYSNWPAISVPDTALPFQMTLESTIIPENILENVGILPSRRLYQPFAQTPQESRT